MIAPSASTLFLILAGVFPSNEKKKLLWLQSRGPPPTALQPQQLFFLKMRRAAATEVEIAFFLKNLSKINTFASKRHLAASGSSWMLLAASGSFWLLLAAPC